GRRIVALRARPSKQPPPVLAIDALELRCYLRIPNLYVPVGQRLHPPLRRDAIVKLLAPDSRRLTWLWPEPAHTFTAESLPDEALRPVAEWVDSVLDHDHAALEAGVKPTQFDLESSVGRDDDPAQAPPKGPRQPKQPKDRRDRRPDAAAGQEIDVVDHAR